jgi:hypothetical protein
MINPDDAPREHYSNLADPPWSIVAGGRVLGTGNTGTDAWRAVLAAAEAERDALRQQVEAWRDRCKAIEGDRERQTEAIRRQLDDALERFREAESALEYERAASRRVQP